MPRYVADVVACISIGNSLSRERFSIRGDIIATESTTVEKWRILLNCCCLARGKLYNSPFVTFASIVQSLLVFGRYVYVTCGASKCSNVSENAVEKKKKKKENVCLAKFTIV